MPIELEGKTRAATEPPQQAKAQPSVPALTILAHPDQDRVGERLHLQALRVGREALLSRIEPVFERFPRSPQRSGESLPLGGLYLSRQPIRLRQVADGIVLDLSTTRTQVAVDGETVGGEVILPTRRVESGVVLTLAHKIVLLLHDTTIPALPDTPPPSFGLVGDSPAMLRLRQDIRRLAPLDVSVLLRGESGTGKELVAQALHQESRRKNGPFVAINVGSLGTSLAAATLFGVERGAFTGADRDREGHFKKARGGTLFLDEIGEAPPEVQVMLLRTLETGEAQPVGSTDTFQIDVRVIAATDTLLEDAIAEGRFKAPLYHRLAGYSLYLPALRERREDLGQLLYFFLRQERAALQQPGNHLDKPWPLADVVARLARHSWPGNVRELRNISRRLIIADQDGSYELDRLLDSLEPPTRAPCPASAESRVATPTARRRTLRKLEEVSEIELLEALRENRWNVQATASALGVSRPNLYRLMEESQSVRTAGELSREEIHAAISSYKGNVEEVALRLEVSVIGLKRRMKALGLPLG